MLSENVLDGLLYVFFSFSKYKVVLKRIKVN